MDLTQEINKMKLKTISQLRKQADKLIQEYGRKLFDKCLVCGMPMSCLHHFFPKSVSSALRYEWKNLVPICQSCHFKHHSKYDPTIHETIIRINGQNWYNELLKQKHKIIKANREYYNNIIKEYERT